jgi:gentisate 1,2-dioxygenase
MTFDAAAPATLAVGEVVEDWAGDALWHEYSQAADPVGSGLVPPVPLARFGPELHAAGATRVVPLDLSDELGVPWPATAPSLLASFVCITRGDELSLRTTATSELLYVLRGSGSTELAGRELHWSEGDVLVLPSGAASRHLAATDTVFYRVDDSPLLAYLGATADTPRFAPTLFPAEVSRARLAEVAAAPDAATRSRVSVLLGHRTFPQTRTVTHTLWAMYGVLPAGRVQKPHRHQSVALDLIVEAPEGCYSLVGRELDDTGAIVDPVCVEWRSGGAFVTPPGQWHSHHNESDVDALLLPIQDAGLHTHLRTLDIRFT